MLRLTGHVQGRTTRQNTTLCPSSRTTQPFRHVRNLLAAAALIAALCVAIVVGGAYPVQATLVAFGVGVGVALWRLFRPGVRS